MMKRVLLVVRPFGPYAIGDLVSGAKEVREILMGAHAHDVVRVVAPMAVTDKPEET